MASKFKTRGNFKHKNVSLRCDAPLHKNLKMPLSSVKSGTFIICSGAAGSGKTVMLCNLFNYHKDPETKQKRDLKGCFHNLYIVSPSMSSFKDDNIFNQIPEEYKYKTLEDFLDNYTDGIEDEEEEESCVIFDDIGNQIRRKENLTRFNEFIDNRRQVNNGRFVVILLLQSLIQIPPSVRGSVNIIIAFKPKAKNERELLYDLTGMDRKYMLEFYNETFQEKADSCCVDLTLNDANDYLFYRNLFNPIDIAE